MICPPGPRFTIISGCGAGMAAGRSCMTSCGSRRARRPGGAACPSAGVIDSQNVKTTEQGGPRGYDAAKKGERA